LAVGWEQHFGGLEQTRRYFFLYLYPNMKEVSPEYLKKLSSPRIFSTLFYPNALAGAILLLLPVSLHFVWQAQQRFTTSARGFLIAAIGIAALGCLYWSGSKGGWLLMLLLAVLWLLRLPFKTKYKQGLIAGLLLLGLLGFFWKYSGFFQKGATSVSARFDYWSASLKTARAHPLMGTGPGTFAITYQKLKRPESEMSRLAHNDYLQQASESGVPGFLLYSAFIIVVLVLTYPSNSSRRTPAEAPMKQSAAQLGQVTAILRTEGSLWFAIWLGTLGWALQSLMEFGLYLPALAWPAFAFMGCLVTHRFNRV
jgi:O-antigen ligase